MNTQNTGLGLLLGGLLMFAGSVGAVEKSAILDWNQRLELSTPVSGMVSDVLVKVGQHVDRNQSLLKLDNRGFQAQLKKARAIVSRSRENFTEAKKELERSEELFERTAVSVHEHQLVKIDYVKAQADLYEAEAGLTQAQLDLEYSHIRSPVSGIVAQVYAHEKQVVVNRFEVSPLVVIADASRMLARTSVNVSELKDLKTGSDIKVKVEGKQYTGSISSVAVEPKEGDQGNLYVLEVSFDPEGAVLRKGQVATIILP